MNHDAHLSSTAAAQIFRRMSEASRLVVGDSGVQLQSHQLLEMCLVVGVPPKVLWHMVQDVRHGSGPSDVCPEVLSIHASSFASTHTPTLAEDTMGPTPTSEQLVNMMQLPKEHLGIPGRTDLCGLPELCFPDGFELAAEAKADSFHFLVLTDVLGNRQQGVVLRMYREIRDSDLCPTESSDSEPAAEALHLWAPYGICVITRFPYYTVLKDCLSCLLSELTSCSETDFEKKVKGFAERLFLVPCPPPGSLQLCFELGPLNIVLTPPEDVDSPILDIGLHLPFLCFTPTTILQILTNILMERRLVFLSCNCPLLTLVAECFVNFLHPLRWRHPYIPVLGSRMLDLVMAPTVFLMGCHSRHLDTISEVDELVLVDIDHGRVMTTQFKEMETPPLPSAAVVEFLTSVQQLQMNSELALAHRSSCTSLASAREREQLHRHQLNQQIHHIFLQLIGNLLRDVSKHLNLKHRVFIKKEFLDSRQPAAQPFYVSFLKTDLFHCFLKARLNQRVDSFSRWELIARFESARVNPEASSTRSTTLTSNSVMKGQNQLQGSVLKRVQDTSLPESPTPQNHSKPSQTSGAMVKDVPLLRTLPLPCFPHDPWDPHNVLLYYSELVRQVSRFMEQTAGEDSEMMAVCLFLRGLARLGQGHFLQALLDFQNLEKINMNLFPLELVKQILESLSPQQLQGVQETEELKGLLHGIMETHWDRVRPEETIKDFELPRQPLNRQEFSMHIQAIGVVGNTRNTDCLFDILAEGQQKVVQSKTFNELYSHWRKMRSEVDSIMLAPEVAKNLLDDEQVSVVSNPVKTSCGLGRLALSQKRLFLLSEAHPYCRDIALLRDIEEVEPGVPTSGLPRKVPSLKIKVRGRKEVFTANLRSDRDLWAVILQEGWAGKVLSERHKDPQYDQQAHSNIQLIHAVAKCGSHPRTTHVLSQLAQLDRTIQEVLPVVPQMTSDALKHTLHLSDSHFKPCPVSVLLYIPGSLDPCESTDSPPKLWCALCDGRVLVYDAASWMMEQTPISAGRSRLNCMIGVGRDQVWLGSEDSFIYIISTQDLCCRRRLLAHRNQVSAMVYEALPGGEGNICQVYSCSLDGTVVLWDPVSMEMKSQFQLQSCWQLRAIALHHDHLWCCAENIVLTVSRNGNQLQSVTQTLSPDPGSISLSCFIILPQRDEVWMLCTKTSRMYVWRMDRVTSPDKVISIPDSSEAVCMIHVKKEVWVGGGTLHGNKGRIYIINAESYRLEKELEAPCGHIKALCSAEDRYVLSGSEDGKAIIWKVD
ncbi:DENN domain-containing protein 3-like isoform X2 [Narcine bancroftii]|uniref:DENN domain-containing protein 3-like isoform X2 n=1 Tax=Narcine bancroftii TaxID=1343680 RepID=UPI0038315380